MKLFNTFKIWPFNFWSLTDWSCLLNTQFYFIYDLWLSLDISVLARWLDLLLYWFLNRRSNFLHLFLLHLYDVHVFIQWYLLNDLFRHDLWLSLIWLRWCRLRLWHGNRRYLGSCRLSLLERNWLPLGQVPDILVDDVLDHRRLVFAGLLEHLIIELVNLLVNIHP